MKLYYSTYGMKHLDIHSFTPGSQAALLTPRGMAACNALPAAWAGDCNQGGSTCWGDGSFPNGAAGATFPNYDISDDANHGNKIIGGIRGSADLGAELRGITRITTDHWKISSNSKAECA